MKAFRTWRGMAIGALLAFALPSAVAATPSKPAAAAAQWKIYGTTNTGIPGNYVYSLAIDARGTKWLTANDPVWDEGGLARFDGRTWNDFTNVDGKSPTHDVGMVHFDAAGIPWVASPRGLLRFDGKKLRVVYNMSNTPWPTSRVSDFAWDGKGNLWVSLADVTTTKGGLAKFDGSAWTVYTTKNGIPWTEGWDNVEAVEIDAQDNVFIGSNVLGGAKFDGTSWTWMKEGWVSEIAIAPNGQPWYAFATGGVKSWNGSRWVDRTPPIFTSGFPFVTKDRAGDMWVTTYIGSIWRFHAGKWTPYVTRSLSHVYTLAFDLKNRPWAGGIGGLDMRRADGSWDVFTVQNTGLASRQINDILVDSIGHVWFGTAGGGVSKFDGVRWTDFNPYNSGSAPWPFQTDSAYGGVEDEEGNFWTTLMFHGIGRWDGTGWTGYLPSRDLESMTRDPSGKVWASGWDGVYVWTGTDWEKVETPQSGEIGPIAADAAGNIWVATATGLEKWDGSSWSVYTTSNSGIPSDYVVTVAAEATDNAVWVGTDSGLARFDGSTWTVFTEANSGLPADFVSAVAFAPNGHVWVGAFDGSTWPYHGGVADFDGTNWTAYTAENSPLPHNQVEAVAVEDDGTVWIGTASDGAATIDPAP